MDEKLFLEMKAEIEALTDVSSPNLPVAVALQEAEDLAVWCQPDKSSLEAAGLSWELVTSLPLRANMCRVFQSQWQKEYQSQEESQRVWGNCSPSAYSLRDELVHHQLYAYRNFPDLRSKVQHIAQDLGHAGMIQNLSDLSVLGKANPAPLVKISFDMKLLDQAEVQSAEMAKLLAKNNGDKMSVSASRVLRDKAYTYMKQAVDEIRQCGQYVFYRNEERKKGYISRYKKRLGKSDPDKPNK
jgi:hypothetical protein